MDKQPKFKNTFVIQNDPNAYTNKCDYVDYRDHLQSIVKKENNDGVVNLLQNSWLMSPCRCSANKGGYCMQHLCKYAEEHPVKYDMGISHVPLTLPNYQHIMKKEDNVKSDGAVKEAVNHPDHYSSGVYEVINIIDHYNLDFNTGNAAKYILRAGVKDPNKEIEDLKKAIWYLEHKIELLTRKKNEDMMKTVYKT